MSDFGRLDDPPPHARLLGVRVVNGDTILVGRERARRRIDVVLGAARS